MENLTAEDDLVDEIMKILRCIPKEPDPVEVMAAEALIRNVSSEEQFTLEEIAQQPKPQDVPEELFFIYKEMQKRLVQFQFAEKKKDALHIIDLDNTHKVFKELLHRASINITPAPVPEECISFIKERELLAEASGSGSGSGSKDNDELKAASYRLFYGTDPPESGSGQVSQATTLRIDSKDDSYVDKGKAPLYDDGDSKEQDSSTPSVPDGEKLDYFKFASLLDSSSKKDTRELNVRGKLTNGVDSVPDQIEKLSSLVTLDLSENRIKVLPPAIRGLSSLERWDLSSNRISKLPETIGDLSNLVVLDLGGNNLTKIPVTIGRLVNLQELELNSNNLYNLPDSIGSMTSLRKLNIETNNLDELPYTIGQCTSLQELRVDYNRLRGFPEAVGKIGSLEILSARYNNIRHLPTTMATATKLRELNVSFNEVEFVPDSLCFATSLVRLNLSNNFANLQELPISLGNLEMLEEIDISNNQIRRLPGSLRHLTRLTTLHIEQNPLEEPPREIAERGPEAVIEYLNNLAASMDIQPVGQRRKSWVQKIASRLKKKESRRGDRQE